jgi:hypothetical protein
MLDMRFAGDARFIGHALAQPLPDNSDATAPSQAAAAAMPGMPVPGVNWTRHSRPLRPKPPTRRGPHLTVVK